jgi:hypothetical protein
VSEPGDATPKIDEALAEVSPERRRRARRLAWAYTAAGVFMLPWIVYLAVTLPKRDLDLHYRAAWVGFDCLLAFTIIRTAYMAFRVDQRVQFAATATATLLIVDAWFDITTSGSRSQFIEALILAAFIEIPSALFSRDLARQVNRRILSLALLEGAGDELAAERRWWRRSQPDR